MGQGMKVHVVGLGQIRPLAQRIELTILAHILFVGLHEGQDGSEVLIVFKDIPGHLARYGLFMELQS